jgi:membrane-associated phospholipid phosphatase
MIESSPGKDSRLVKTRKLPSVPLPRVGENLLWAGAVVAVLCLYLIAFGDKPTALFLHSAFPGISRLHKTAHEVTLFGNSALYLVPSLILWLVLRWVVLRTRDPGRRQKFSRMASLCLFLFVAVAFSGLLTDLLKAFFGRARPTLLFHRGFYSFSFFQNSARMWSFPSGHANTIFALATTGYLVAPRGWFFYFSVAVLVAASRVVLGDHYPSDVILGAYLGVLTTHCLRQVFLDRGIDIFPRDRRRT